MTINVREKHSDNRKQELYKRIQAQKENILINRIILLGKGEYLGSCIALGSILEQEHTSFVLMTSVIGKFNTVADRG